MTEYKDSPESEKIAAVKDGVFMLMLVTAAVTLALTAHGELAATALGGALSYMTPGGRRGQNSGLRALGLGLVFGSIVGLSGCTAAEVNAARNTLKPIVEVTCNLCRKICPVAEALTGAGSSGGEEMSLEEIVQ
jgi:Mn2+/Fe2+ NRAMP family transporter